MDAIGFLDEPATERTEPRSAATNAVGMGTTHHNRYLFSNHYLENLLAWDPHWPAGLGEAMSFLAWIQDLHAEEREQLSYYNEAQLEEHWFKPILSSPMKATIMTSPI